jgi:hypothetical protein
MYHQSDLISVSWIWNSVIIVITLIVIYSTIITQIIEKTPIISPNVLFSLIWIHMAMDQPPGTVFASFLLLLRLWTFREHGLWLTCSKQVFYRSTSIHWNPIKSLFLMVNRHVFFDGKQVMQNKTRQRRVAQRDVWLRARGLPCTRPITVQVAHKELVPWVPSCSLGRDSKVGLLQDLHVAQDWLRWNWYHLHDTGHGCSAHGLPTWVRAHTKGHHSTSQAGYRQYSVDCKQWISRWHRHTLCVFFFKSAWFRRSPLWFSIHVFTLKSH